MQKDITKETVPKYDHKAIENKWREKWESDGIYQPDLKNAKKPFYNLMMFPYPSAEGLHVGSVFTFSGIDAFGRFMRMQGFDVFEPIGLDAFGIHSENYALKTNTHPKDLADRTEQNFYRQLHAIGNGFDWRHQLETNKPDYYKWTQWLFLQLYKKGLAERKKASVNWCPSCLTVLADEQVIAGRCERCDSEVVLKELEQWFFKITEYADRLLKNLDWIDWDESVKTMQKNWIGKKIGAEITFKVKIDENTSKYIKVFTTRPDTIFGVTAIVIAPEHPLAKQLLTTENKKTAESYIKASSVKNDTERLGEVRVKTGVKTGSFAMHPLTNSELPIWISDYVIGSYGTGAIMLVPAHDQRDLEFAKQFSIPIKIVVKGYEDITPIKGGLNDINKVKDEENNYESAISENKMNRLYIDKAYESSGLLVNSEAYDGLTSEKACEKIVNDLQIQGCGEQKTTYHIRDWLISRQRYWGPPIPIIYCKDCGTVPVPEEDLPVELPYIKNFRPTGTGKAPLGNYKDFYQTTCPKCNKLAQRETDVSDTFLDSAWYFLRYPSSGYQDIPFDSEITSKWLPVHSYIGGKEHTVLHLLYSRFVTMVLYDLGRISFEEPFTQFRPNGLIIKDGAKMSKSKGNVINPDIYIEKYGSDILRCYLGFLGPFTVGGDFRDSGINGMKRFINRVWQFTHTAAYYEDRPTGEEAYLLHKTIKKVTEDIKELHYNTAIAAIMELLNELQLREQVSKYTVVAMMQLLAPFAPHITEELWNKLDQKRSIHISKWPAYDETALIKDEVQIIVQINGKTRDRFVMPAGSENAAVEAAVLQLPRVQKYLENMTPKKYIHVTDRLINIVV